MPCAYACVDDVATLGVSHHTSSVWTPRPMNRTGHYEYVPSQGWVKCGDEIPTLADHVWTPKGDVPYYDKGLRMKIESKAHKRLVMKEAGLKEGGVITNPDKRWDGHTKNSAKYKPTAAQRAERQKRHDWIRSQGGAEGLLKQQEHGGSHG